MYIQNILLKKIGYMSKPRQLRHGKPSPEEWAKQKEVNGEKKTVWEMG